MRAVGVGLLLVGGLIVWRMIRSPKCLNSGRTEPGRSPGSGSGRFRAGPWPGLSPAGAVVLLGCALLLGGGQLALGDPRTPWPDLPLLAVLAVLPMALATRLVGAPGAASAVCGAYLLPRALLSLVDPGIEPPPLLLVPALAFDVSAWLRAGDLANLSRVGTGRQPRWRQRTPRLHAPSPPRGGVAGAGVTGGVARAGVARGGVTGAVTRRFYAGGWRRGLVGPRRCGRGRGVVAGAIFGGVLAAIQPAFAVLLGAEPSAWSGTSLWLASGVTALGCAIAGLAAANGRDTAA